MVSAILTILPSHQVDVTIPPALGALERLIVPRREKVSTIYFNQMILKIYAEIPSVSNSTLKKEHIHLNCLSCFYPGEPDIEIT